MRPELVQRLERMVWEAHFFSVEGRRLQRRCRVKTGTH